LDSGIDVGQDDGDVAVQKGTPDQIEETRVLTKPSPSVPPTALAVGKAQLCAAQPTLIGPDAALLCQHGAARGSTLEALLQREYQIIDAEECSGDKQARSLNQELKACPASYRWSLGQDLSALQVRTRNMSVLYHEAQGTLNKVRAALVGGTPRDTAALHQEIDTITAKIERDVSVDVQTPAFHVSDRLINWGMLFTGTGGTLSTILTPLLGISGAGFIAAAISITLFVCIAAVKGYQFYQTRNTQKINAYKQKLQAIYQPIVKQLEEIKVQIERSEFNALKQQVSLLADHLSHRHGEPITSSTSSLEVEQLRKRADSLEQENKQLKDTVVALKDGQDQILALLLQQAQTASHPAPENTA